MGMICVWTHMYYGKYHGKGQRATLVLYFLSTFMWILGIKLSHWACAESDRDSMRAVMHR